jgi:hypothetical protein
MGSHTVSIRVLRRPFAGGRKGFQDGLPFLGRSMPDEDIGAGPVLNEFCIHKVVAIFYNDVYYALSEKSEEQEQRLRLQTAASNTLEGGWYAGCQQITLAWPPSALLVPRHRGFPRIHASISMWFHTLEKEG